MPRKASLRLAPRKRGGSLPVGEARGGDFALSELPHPFPRIISRCEYTHILITVKMGENKNRHPVQDALYACLSLAQF